MRHVSCRVDILWIAGHPRTALEFWSAAIYCRFDIFRSVARPRAALIYFGMRHVPCRFRIAVRLVPLWITTLSSRFGKSGVLHTLVPLYITTRPLSLSFIHFPELPFQHTSTQAQLDPSEPNTFPAHFLHSIHKHANLLSILNVKNSPHFFIKMPDRSNIHLMFLAGL